MKSGLCIFNLYFKTTAHVVNWQKEHNLPACYQQNAAILHVKETYTAGWDLRLTEYAACTWSRLDTYACQTFLAGHLSVN